MENPVKLIPTPTNLRIAKEFRMNREIFTNTSDLFIVEAFVLFVLDPIVPLRSVFKKDIHFKLEDYLSIIKNDERIFKDSKLIGLINNLQDFLNEDKKILFHLNQSMRFFIPDISFTEEQNKEFELTIQREKNLLVRFLKSDAKVSLLNSSVVLDILNKELEISINDRISIISNGHTIFFEKLLNSYVSAIYAEDLTRSKRRYTKLALYLEAIKTLRSSNLNLETNANAGNKRIVFLKISPSRDSFEESNESLKNISNYFDESNPNLRLNETVFLTKTFALRNSAYRSSALSKQFLSLNRIRSIYQFGLHGGYSLLCFSNEPVSIIDFQLCSFDGKPLERREISIEEFAKEHYSVLAEDYFIDQRHEVNCKVRSDLDSRFNSIDSKYEHLGKYTTIAAFLGYSNDDYKSFIYRGYQADEDEVRKQGFSFKEEFRNIKESVDSKNAPYKYLKFDGITDEGFVRLENTYDLVVKSTSMKEKKNDGQSTIDKMAIKPWDVIISTKLSPTKAFVIGEKVLDTFQANGGLFLIPSGNMIVIRAGNKFSATYLKIYLESDKFKNLILEKYGNDLTKAFVTVKDFGNFPLIMPNGSISSLVMNYWRSFERICSYKKETLIQEARQNKLIKNALE